jgi:para-nitrobenzyl esterase
MVDGLVARLIENGPEKVNMSKHRVTTKRSKARCLGLSLCVIVGTSFSSMPSGAGEAAQENTVVSGSVVSTVDGPVRGFVRNGVNIFLGIPYAAPPIGVLRWQPPQPVKRWKDARDATRYAPTCPQVSELGAFAGPTSTSEDCLYLNVFTTGVNKNGKKMPALVWIHGGGNIDGESNDYDASKLAAGGPDGVPTVVVTINYRLGLFGFFSHPAIDSEGHLYGNYGILDQQAVLRWVQRNIAAFGGDPNRVALGGQSAGAVDTAANLVSPYSNGLFNRAILQSSPGFLASNFVSTQIAQGRGTNFAKAAGCTGTDAAAAKCLRNLSTTRILQLQGTLNADGPYASGILSIDGAVIPRTPDQAFSTGNFNKMPIMGGGTRDELTFISGIAEYFSGPPQTPMTAGQYSTAVSTGAPCQFCVGGTMPSGTAARYPLAHYNGDPMLAYERVTTDSVRCQEVNVMRRLASQVPIYAYDFTYASAPYYFPKMPGFKPLAGPIRSISNSSSTNGTADNSAQIWIRRRVSPGI